MLLVGQVCPPNFSLIQPDVPKCYRFVNDRVTYSTARERCLLLGGHLVTIGSSMIQEMISGRLRDIDTGNEYDRTWIGLREQLTTWHWAKSKACKTTPELSPVIACIDASIVTDKS